MHFTELVSTTRTILSLVTAALLSTGCQAPHRVLTPQLIRASTIANADKDAILHRWELAIDLCNEFLLSSFNNNLPEGASLSLDSEGMKFVTEGQAMSIQLVLIDDYRKSSCVCATVDTHENIVYVHRPWGASTGLPIVTCNTFFSNKLGSMNDPVANLTALILRFTTILYYEKHAHIGSWEWFKCQKLEWLLGSGHHRVSMQRPTAASQDFLHFWREVHPATPTILQQIKK